MFWNFSLYSTFCLLRSIHFNNIGILCIFLSVTVYAVIQKYSSVYPFPNWGGFGLFLVFSITDGATMKTLSFVRFLCIMYWPSNFSYVYLGICTVMSGGDECILQRRKLRFRAGAQLVWGWAVRSHPRKPVGVGPLPGGLPSVSAGRVRARRWSGTRSFSLPLDATVVAVQRADVKCWASEYGPTHHVVVTI